MQGSPTGAAKLVAPGGDVSDSQSWLSGCSIITADSLHAAAQASRNHPHLDAGDSIYVYETYEVM